MGCAVEKRWQAGRARAGGVKPSRAAPSRAEPGFRFDHVERSIAEEYTVVTELPRQHCRGWQKEKEYPEYPCELKSSAVVPVRLAEHP
jgi:hypothetical protein